VFPGGSLDAVESRQPGPILADVRAAARRGSLDPLVVLDLGNNGLINPDDLTRTLQSLSGARLVLVFNLHLEPLDRAWQQPNNSTIARVVPGFANARIVDWDKLASTHQGWLYSDDLHLTPTGAVAYARVVAATYRTAEQPTGQPVGP
jgi:hypothetical protein